MNSLLDDLEAVFEKHGYIDYVLSAVNMSGEIQTVLRVGASGMSDSNRQRLNDLFGIIKDVEIQARIGGLKDREML